MSKSKEQELLRETEGELASVRSNREPAWRAKTEADPPLPRPLRLTLALLALGIWAAFLAFTAWG